MIDGNRYLPSHCNGVRNKLGARWWVLKGGGLWFCSNEFGITVFIKGGKHDEWAIGGYVLPVVEADNDAMDGEKQIVIWLLPRLGDGIELAFV